MFITLNLSSLSGGKQQILIYDKINITSINPEKSGDKQQILIYDKINITSINPEKGQKQ